MTKELSRDWPNALGAASSAGQHFKLGGGTLSFNDYFIGKEWKRQQDELTKLENKKKRVDGFQAHGDRAAVTMERCKIAESGPKDLQVLDLKELLKWKLYCSKETTKQSSQ